MRIDLHAHSTASDGTDTPAAVVANAAAAGLDVVALTDHDTVDGWEEAAAALPSGLTLVPGAEISCASDGRSVHVLAYLFDPNHPEFVDERSRLMTDRVRRARAMVEKLRQLGVAIAWPDVEAAAEEGSIGRPHIASALVALGVVPDLASAFTPKWIGRGGRAYAEKYVLDAADAVRMITDAGGVAVLAHPLGSDGGGPAATERLVERLADAGLIGVEVDHPDHDDDARGLLRGMARAHGLVATGSSDYHGDNKAIALGCNTTEPSAYHALVERATGSRPITR